MRKPGNGDIFVPAGSVTLLGTTATPVPDPDDISVPPEEVEELKRLGAEMLPMAATARILRAFAGVRPLFGSGPGGNTREISRGFAVIDHEAEHGVPGLLSVVGGKLTTYRMMAEKAVDVAAARLGVTVPCRTAEEPILPPPDPDAVRRLVQPGGPGPGAGRGRPAPGDAAADRRGHRPARRPAGGVRVRAGDRRRAGGHRPGAGRTVPGRPPAPDPAGHGHLPGRLLRLPRRPPAGTGGDRAPEQVPALLARFQAERWRGVRGGLGGLELRAAELNYALARAQLAMEPAAGTADAVAQMGGAGHD
ncbi:MAG: hypothetical protein A6D92_13750 [Symbiobacterium thermophilum]|uniref:Uncharacterized protein n=1 Tax=Symbiobacterium thermophilum TaxID=2734 RepID=A0A1Y2T502_SYMTR|nr:MAG: hypothetical protein A6D92_13750 [Symbiobacterium thermophilum]